MSNFNSCTRTKPNSLSSPSYAERANRPALSQNSQIHVPRAYSPAPLYQHDSASNTISSPRTLNLETPIHGAFQSRPPHQRQHNHGPPNLKSSRYLQNSGMSLELARRGRLQRLQNANPIGPDLNAPHIQAQIMELSRRDQRRNNEVRRRQNGWELLKHQMALRYGGEAQAQTKPYETNPWNGLHDNVSQMNKMTTLGRGDTGRQAIRDSEYSSISSRDFEAVGTSPYMHDNDSQLYSATLQEQNLVQSQGTGQSSIQTAFHSTGNSMASALDDSNPWSSTQYLNSNWSQSTWNPVRPEDHSAQEVSTRSVSGVVRDYGAIGSNRPNRSGVREQYGGQSVKEARTQSSFSGLPDSVLREDPRSKESTKKYWTA